MYNQFNTKLDLLLVNIRNFCEDERCKAIKERQLDCVKFSFENVFWFQSYQWLINLRLFLPILVNLLGIVS